MRLGFNISRVEFVVSELYKAEMLINEMRQELSGVDELDCELIRKQLNMIYMHLFVAYQQQDMQRQEKGLPKAKTTMFEYGKHIITEKETNHFSSSESHN